MRLIVTRPAAQATAAVGALRAVGVDAVALPLIGIEPPADRAPAQTAWQALLGADPPAFVMFVSANAVEHFFALRPPPAQPAKALRGESTGWPAGVLAGATGPGTAAALHAAGVAPASVVQPAADAPRLDAEALWDALHARCGPGFWQGRKAWVVRGEDGRDWLAEQLRQAGAQTRFVAAYRRVRPRPTPADETLLRHALARPADHRWWFTSSEAVAHLGALWPAADWHASRAWAAHPRIAASVRALGFGTVDPAPGDEAAIARACTGGAAPAA